LEKSKFIPYGRQDINQNDIDAVIRVLKSDFITQGPAVPVFEQKLCDYTGAKYAVAVNSCTAALHIACLALGLGHGDILWTSPITFVASANCAIYCGASIDFVDVEPGTALMSVEKLKEKLEWAEKKGKLPKIVIPVHFSGQPCDMEDIYALGQKYGFKIIEDAAHAIGAEYQDNPVGNCKYSDITVFSFHPVKIITTGEGGAAMTNSKNLSIKMKLLSSHGITRDKDDMYDKSCAPWYYEQIDLGFNYRLTDIHAALGSSQIDRLDKYVLCRDKIANLYNKNFENNAKVAPLIQKKNRKSSHHLYVLKIQDKSLDRNLLYKLLRDNGIGVNVHYIPVYRQPYFKNKVVENYLRESEIYYSSAISLPIFPTMTKEDVDYVVRKTIQNIEKIKV
jgi:UDP-4-amino-4,6-dideoxy-N-acetyl-beta-L-altrosamine transaminase